MSHSIGERRLVCALTGAIKNTKDFVAQLTDYQGGAITTEYLLTSDIAREMLRQNFEVRVECMYRKLVNLLTVAADGTKSTDFGAERADVVITHQGLIPIAIIEVKVRAQSGKALEPDLNRLTRAIGALKQSIAVKVIGAVVFQVHVPSRVRFTQEAQYIGAAKKIEGKISKKLDAYARKRREFVFTIRPLQDDSDGASGRELEDDGEGKAWGVGGHATRYHAIIVRKKKTS
jgi:hypothetical protein